MAKIRLYTIIFAALMVISTVQFALEWAVLDRELIDMGYWVIFWIVIVMSSIKAVAVAGWYMHMLEEPRAITYLAMAGLLCVIALTAGAGYSVL